jgi:hypothetical protein
VADGWWTVPDERSTNGGASGVQSEAEGELTWWAAALVKCLPQSDPYRV